MIVRVARTEDGAAIARSVAAAFGRLDEAAIIEGVRGEGAVLTELVAEWNGEVAGYVMFSRLGAQPNKLVAGLGPLAVAPDCQNRGLGASLVLRGLAHCQGLGCEACVVLGDPAYYGRFGFTAAPPEIRSPYTGLAAFQAIEFVPGALGLPIALAYPAAFG